MEMKKYIELGEKKAGTQLKLAEYLGQYDSGLRAVKAGKKGLPDAICIKLADFIEVDRLEVIAASNLVTEKDEERRKLFESCFTTAASVGFLMLVVDNSGLLSYETGTSIMATAIYFVLC